MAGNLETQLLAVEQPADASAPLYSVQDGFVARLRFVTVRAQYQTVGQDGDTNQRVAFVSPVVAIGSPGATFANIPSGIQAASVDQWNPGTAAGNFEAIETWALGLGAALMANSQFAEVTVPTIATALPDVWILPRWTYTVFGALNDVAVGLVELLPADSSSAVGAGDTGGQGVAKIPFLLPLG